MSPHCERGPVDKGLIAPHPQPALSGRPPYQDSHLLEKALTQRPAQLVIQHLRWHL